MHIDVTVLLVLSRLSKTAANSTYVKSCFGRKHEDGFDGSGAEFQVAGGSLLSLFATLERRSAADPQCAQTLLSKTHPFRLRHFSSPAVLGVETRMVRCAKMWRCRWCCRHCPKRHQTRDMPNLVLGRRHKSGVESGVAEKRCLGRGWRGAVAGGDANVLSIAAFVSCTADFQGPWTHWACWERMRSRQCGGRT